MSLPSFDNQDRTLPAVVITLREYSFEEKPLSVVLLYAQTSLLALKFRKYNIKVGVNTSDQNRLRRASIQITDWSRFSKKATKKIRKLLENGKVIQDQRIVAISEFEGVPDERNLGLTPLQFCYIELNNKIIEKYGEEYMLEKLDEGEEGDEIKLEGDLNRDLLHVIIKRNYYGRWITLGRFIEDFLERTRKSVQTPNAE